MSKSQQKKKQEKVFWPVEFAPPGYQEDDWRKMLKVGKMAAQFRLLKGDNALEAFKSTLLQRLANKQATLPDICDILLATVKQWTKRGTTASAEGKQMEAVRAMIIIIKKLEEITPSLEEGEVLTAFLWHVNPNEGEKVLHDGPAQELFAVLQTA